MKRRLREPVSGLTHLVGGLLALVALIVLLRQAAGRVDQLVAFGIFGLSLVALYGASALYHLLPVSPPATARLRRLDHMTIFILIAGTYTPICVLALEGGWRTGLLVLIWTLALCGVVLKLLWMDAPRWLSVGIYLSMGWLAVMAASAIFRAIPSGGIAWILGGGLVYSAGARNVRVPRAVAPLRHGGKRLPFLGDVALHSTNLVGARAVACYGSAEGQISFRR